MAKASGRRWLVFVCFLALFSVAAHPAYEDDQGSIRGAVFLDANRNGKPDSGERGVGWVYFEVSRGGFSKTFFSEWRTTDQFGNEFATGTFGPAPLEIGEWDVTFYVPEGYVATTPVKQTVNIPGGGRGIGEAYLGLYPTAGTAAKDPTLPAGGFDQGGVLLAALAVVAAGGASAFGLGLYRRRRS